MPRKPASEPPAKRRATRARPARDVTSEPVEPDIAEVVEGFGEQRGIPLFPDLDPDVVSKILVFRIVPSATTKSVEPALVDYPFDKFATDKETVARVCGGGNFLVQARGVEKGRVIAAVRFSIEGSPREPGAGDANAGPLQETAGGWVAVKGTTAEKNIALVAYQQYANNSRADTMAALDALGKTNAALLEAVPKLVESIASVTRAPATPPADASELANLRAENTRLRDKVSELERDKLKLELMAQFKQGPIEGALTKALDGETMTSMLNMLFKTLMPQQAQKANVTQAPANLPAAIPAEVRP